MVSFVFALRLLVGCTGSAPPVLTTTSVGATSTPGWNLPSEAQCAHTVPAVTRGWIPTNRATNRSANRSAPTADWVGSA